MRLRHIVVAVDDSREGQAAVLVAAKLAARCRAQVTAVTIHYAKRGDGTDRPHLEDLRQAVRSALAPLKDAPRVDLAVGTGLPGVEISRFAETHDADLVVVGRKHRSASRRLLLGDTADAVARRSRTPCLFVPSGELAFGHALVALDGTERGLSVLIAAMDFARLTGARLRAVSVEPVYENEAGVDRMLTGRSARLLQAIDALVRSSEFPPKQWDRRSRGAGAAVVIHRGPVVSEVLREVERSETDLLCLGYHPGGPAGIIDAGSVARRLAHEAPCGVLTVPL
jgi:universal stress protein E